MAKKSEVQNEVQPEYKSGTVYAATHTPTGERWVILGINVVANKICTAGDPPTIAKLSHCKNIEEIRPMTEKEMNYRLWMFGNDWL